MANYIVKLKKDKYVEWSTVVDAPITYILTREQMIAHLDEQYGVSSVTNNQLRLDRADENGTSAMFNQTRGDLLSCNRAGDNEEKLTLKAILEKYDIKNAKQGDEYP